MLYKRRFEMILFNDMNHDQKRQAILEMLHDGIAAVEFVKVNGEHRKMPCTLSAIHMPPADPKPVTESQKPPRKENLDVIRAFVVDIQEWRSFRIDSVISVVHVQ